MNPFRFALIPGVSVIIGLTRGANAMARANDSGAPAVLEHAADLNTTYEAVLNELKKEGLSVDSASKDAGIKTATSVSGHYSQTGEHLAGCGKTRVDERNFLSDGLHRAVYL